MERFETPVLFLIFNRPDLTEIVFKRIKEIKPRHLFVAADGPRADHPEDKEKCQKARETVLDLIDWDCELKTLFRDENLGCGKGVSGAITWFFEHVEEGIILEDDCLPSYAFFPFCATLLEYHKNDKRIMHISGGSYLPERLLPKSSYYFSKYPFCWGWATWKDAWKKFDYNIVEKDSDYLSNIHISKIEIDYWKNIVKDINNGKIDTWGFRWNLSLWKERGISVISTKNLIQNIGFSDESTHIKTMNPYYKKQNFYDSITGFSMLHSNNIWIDQKADKMVFERYNLRRENNIINRIINKIHGRF